MPETCDCIVLGVGGIGSGALYHLARRGLDVIGIEQFGIAHDQGSSSGETRIIRKAYFEHPDYVPLLLEAYALWEALAQEHGQPLYNECGLMIAGPGDGEAIPGARLAADRHSIAIESITANAARGRFPGFTIPESFDVIYEPQAGFLHVEECVRAHIKQAQAAGARLQTDETVRGWSSDGMSVVVRTDRAEYHAASLVITAGAWSALMLNDLGVSLEVLRKPLYWFNTKSPAYDVAEGASAYYCELPTGSFYGFPSIDGATVKMAEHTGGQPVDDPSALDRSSLSEDEEALAQFVTQIMPDVDPAPARHAVCMYTNTPDRHFIVDAHPELPNIVMGAGFSGHGFKFASVLGRALADLAADGKTELPIGFLSVERDALYP